ncbi:MAG: DNA-directed RNA polymerase subunit alpha C-terminal domain-containing protein [Gemmataceae bacterium]
MNLDLDDLELSFRAASCLESVGVNTVEVLVQWTGLANDVAKSLIFGKRRDCVPWLVEADHTFG